MKLHLPTYLGGYEVELIGEDLEADEEVIGWADEYGTITSSKANIHIGDLISTEDTEWSALVLKKNIHV